MMLPDPIEYDDPPQAANGIHENPAATGYCLILLAVACGIIYSFGAFYPALQQQFDLSYESVSVIFSIFLVSAAAAAPFARFMEQKAGGWLVITIAGTLTGLGLFLASLAESAWHLFLTCGLTTGLCVGILLPVVIRILARSAKKRRVLVLSIVSGGVGIAVIAPLSGWIINNYEWSDGYRNLSIITWVFFIPIGILLKFAFSGNIDHSPEKSEDHSTDSNEGIPSRNFWIAFFYWFCLSFVVHMVIIHISPDAYSNGISLVHSTFLLSVLSGITIIFALLVAGFTSVTDRKTLGIIFSLVGAAVLFWLTEAENMSQFYLFAILFAPVWGGMSVMMSQLYSLGRTTYLNKYNCYLVIGAWGCGGALGAYIGGLSMRLMGDYHLALFINAWVLVAAAVFIWAINPSTQSKLEVQSATDE